MKNSEKPAFPPDRSIDGRYYGGLTKREYIAAMAMQGELAAGSSGFNLDHMRRVATIAVSYTDALLSELEKPTP